MTLSVETPVTVAPSLVLMSTHIASEKFSMYSVLESRAHACRRWTPPSLFPSGVPLSHMGQGDCQARAGLCRRCSDLRCSHRCVLRASPQAPVAGEKASLQRRGRRCDKGEVGREAWTLQKQVMPRLNGRTSADTMQRGRNRGRDESSEQRPPKPRLPVFADVPHLSPKGCNVLWLSQPEGEKL